MHGCGLVALGGQQEVNRFALLVYRAVKILPNAFDQYVGLVHAPTLTHCALVFTEHFSSSGRKRIAHRLMVEWLDLDKKMDTEFL